ncbi:MAG: LapA family protein, partial [Burkholderiaceae bacterium]|nr:LapA family protein [Burkholderiaceae bacterium]
MKTRTLLLLLVLVAIAAFATLNWGAFMATTTLSLGVADVQAPLGLVMLGMIVFVSAVFLVFLVYLQASILLEARRHARELQANRGLADKAEASRFT